VAHPQHADRSSNTVKNEALRPEGRSLHSSVGGILRSRKPFSALLVTAATCAFIPELESSGFSAKEDKMARGGLSIENPFVILKNF
jgi:hypothetical protein